MNLIYLMKIGKLAIEFIETLLSKHKGELRTNLKLELFQKAKHQAVFDLFIKIHI